MSWFNAALRGVVVAVIALAIVCGIRTIAAHETLRAIWLEFAPRAVLGAVAIGALAGVLCARGVSRLWIGLICSALVMMQIPVAYFVLLGDTACPDELPSADWFVWLVVQAFIGVAILIPAVLVLHRWTQADARAGIPIR